MSQFIPKCEVPQNSGFNEGDLFIAKGWRYEPNGRMHPCQPGEETTLQAVIAKGAK